MARLSASFSATMRVRLEDRPGVFADLARAIADVGGSLEAIDLVRVEPGVKVRDVTVLAGDAAHIEQILAAARSVQGIEIEHVSDRTERRPQASRFSAVRGQRPDWDVARLTAARGLRQMV